MKKSVLTLIMLVTVIFIGRAQRTTTRQLDDFSAVSVGEAIKLTLVPGNRNEAKITADNISLDKIETNIFAGQLKIELAGSRYQNIAVEIILTYKELEEVSVGSAARTTTKGPIKAEELEISVSSAGFAELEVDVESLDINVSSSGELVLEGKAKSQRVGVSSAGEYMAYDMECGETYVKASSAGSARVTATQKIDARASSAGSVRYKGDPDKVYVNSSSGGSARKSN